MIGEANLEADVLKIERGWATMEFIVQNHRDKHDLFILGSLEEIFALLDDNQSSLQTMLGNRYIKGSLSRCEAEL
jgi:hypothetical protein